MSNPKNQSMKVGMLLFDNITALDLIGPMEPLSLVPGWTVELVARTMDPISAVNGLMLQPNISFADAPQYDLFVVPGGPGVDTVLDNDAINAFVRKQSLAAQAVFGICTGSLLLCSAGVLDGHKASCHWQAAEFLTAYGATPTGQRTTIDGKFFTSGGVTAGIDMALKLIAEIVDPDTAMRIQLLLEYDPEPPLKAGHPKVAPKSIVEGLQSASRDRYASRKAVVERTAAKITP